MAGKPVSERRVTAESFAEYLIKRHGVPSNAAPLSLMLQMAFVEGRLSGALEIADEVRNAVTSTESPTPPEQLR